MDNNVTVDAIHANGTEIRASGSVAQRLMETGFNVNALRTLDTLRKDEWKQYDETVVQVARQRLVAVEDLMSRGLTFTVTNPLGTTRVEWENEGDMSAANVSMSGVTEGENDRLTYDLLSVPLPIIHKDFKINIRALAASRKNGEPLDTSQAARAARLVAEKIEEILFDGSTVNGTNTPVYGYTNALNRNTGSISNWANSGVTGATIVTETLAIQAALAGDHMYGPYMLYVPADYWNKLMDDYKAASDRTILERILAIQGIAGVKMSPNLTGSTTGEVVMVQMSSDVVDMVEGMQPTTVQWDTHGGMVVNFKVMAIMVPRMKYDASTQSGIAHYSV